MAKSVTTQTKHKKPKLLELVWIWLTSQYTLPISVAFFFFKVILFTLYYPGQKTLCSPWAAWLRAGLNFFLEWEIACYDCGHLEDTQQVPQCIYVAVSLGANVLSCLHWSGWGVWGTMCRVLISLLGVGGKRPNKFCLGARSLQIRFW